MNKEEYLKQISSHWASKRSEAYSLGVSEYEDLMKVPTFRDFVTLFMTEGFRKGKWSVSIANTNPNIIKLAAYWLTRLSDKKLRIKFQLYKDQDENSLRVFWSEVSRVPCEEIKFSYKTNSGSLKGRKNKCLYGVASIEVYDTSFRNRMQAWCDQIEIEWKNLQSQDHKEGHLIWDQEYRAGADPAALTN